MKSITRKFLISFLAAAPLFLVGCGDNPSQQPQADDAHGIIVKANHKLVTMRVPQIPCDDCKAKVEAVLKSEDGVVSFRVFKSAEREGQNVFVAYDPQKINLDQIKALFTKLNKTVETVIEN